MALTTGKWGGIQYTVTAGAVKLSTALGVTVGADGVADVAQSHFKQIDFKAAAANTGTVYLGKSNVAATPANACASVEKGTGYTIGPFQADSISSEDIFIIGTANDILFIAVTR